MLIAQVSFMFVHIFQNTAMMPFPFRFQKIYIPNHRRLCHLFFLHSHKFRMPLRYEFIGNLIKILKCIILLCPNQTIFTFFEMKCKQMRLSVNQTNIDVNCNKYKQNQPTDRPTNQHLQNVSNFMENDWKLADKCEIFCDWHNRCHRAIFLLIFLSKSTDIPNRQNDVIVCKQIAQRAFFHENVIQQANSHSFFSKNFRY